MAIVAGIDEAGYGPTLGPLVVTMVALEVPDGLAADGVWDALSGTVARKSGRRDARLVVDDSKKVFSQTTGLECLEESVLSFLGVSGSNVDGFRDLLQALTASDGAELTEYPWFRDRDLALPVASEASHIESHVDSATRACAAAGVRVAAIRCVPIQVGEYNRQVARMRNKSLVLFRACQTLLQHLRSECGPRSCQVFVDKHGGRNRYGYLLLRAFHDCQVRKLEEGPQVSRYDIAWLGGHMTVSFLEKGDALYFPIALASMVSKYVRELCMKLFNEFWQERVAGLAPTAGYPQDAARFLAQISNVERRLAIDRTVMVRAK